MILAAMAAGGGDDLICDFAEIYHIYDWRGLPLRTAAVLAAGLPDECRVRRRLRGQTVPLDTLLLAKLVDYAALLVWGKTKDGQKGVNPPKSVVEMLAGKAPPPTKLHVYRTKEDFLRAYHAMTGEA